MNIRALIAAVNPTTRPSATQPSATRSKENPR